MGSCTSSADLIPALNVGTGEVGCRGEADEEG